MKKYPDFPFNPKDFLSDRKVQAMTDAEVGFYMKMLCHEWMEDGISLAGTVKEWWVKGGTVAECFFERNGRLFNPRLEKEREKKRIWSEKSSSGGKVGAEIKRINVKFKGGIPVGVPPLKGRAKKHREPGLLYDGDLVKTSELFAKAMGEWNTLAVKYELCLVMDIVPGSLRARNTLALFCLGGFDLPAFIKKIGSQPFLLGASKAGWKVSYDWAIKIDNYMKIMEGNYIQVEAPAADGAPAGRSWDDFAAAHTEEKNPWDMED